MLRRKIIVLVLVMVITGLVACTPNTSTKPQESVTPQETTTVNKEETTSVEDGTSDVYRGVDVEDICKNLSINGKQVDFPWTLNSLGEGYEYSAYKMDEETKFGAALLTYQGRQMDIVQVYETGDDITESLIIKVNTNGYIKLYDIDFEMNETDIVKRLGQPSKIYDDDPDFISYSYITPEIRIKVSFFKNNNKLFLCTVTLTDEYISKIVEGN